MAAGGCQARDFRGARKATWHLHGAQPSQLSYRGSCVLDSHHKH